MSMDPEVKKKWVEALRSGNYKQATSRLCQRSHTTHEVLGYCCLGVLCDVQGLWGESAYPTKLPSPLEKDTIKEEAGGFTADMMSVLGFDGRDQGQLINMNDVQHKNFSEIADWIEKNL